MNGNVVVIGGGISGLATAALLGRDGWRVTVLERGRVLGGRAVTHREGGFTLNYGPHALYLPAPTRAVLDELGVSLRWGRPDAGRARFALGGELYTLGSSPLALLRTKLLGPRGKWQLATTLLRLRGIRPESAAGQTFGAWLAGQVTDARARRLLAGLATVSTYSHPVETLEASPVLAALRELARSNGAVAYVEGGWASLYDGLAGAVGRAGGVIRTGVAVEQVLVEGGRTTGVRAGGELVRADAVVAAVPPERLAALAPAGSALAAELRPYAALTPTRAYCYTVGATAPPRGDVTFVYDMDTTCYYSVHSAAAPSLAPPGGWLLSAMAYLAPDEAEGDAHARRRAAARAGLDRYFPGWRAHLAVEQEIPAAVVMGAMRLPGQGAAARPPVRSRVTGGFYVAGDSTALPELLADACFASARAVAVELAGQRLAPDRAEGAPRPLVRTA